MTCIVDTASINLSVAAGQLSADLIVDPGAGLAPNPLIVNPTGVYVIGSDGWIPLPTTLAFSSADGHTYVATTSVDLRSFIGPGDKIRVVQSGVPGYFFVTAIAAGTITLYGGTDYVLAALPISLPYFSKVKSPIGFPLATPKWTEELRDTATRTQASPVAGTWYNPGSLSPTFPIGVWRVLIESSADVSLGGSAALIIASTLSTANNSESDNDFSSYGQTNSGTALRMTTTREKVLTIAVKTSYFVNIKTDSAAAASINLHGDLAPTTVRAECVYAR